MTLFGLDLNASRARAVGAALGEFPLTVPLDPPEAELPLWISLEQRTPAVGRAGLRVCRRLPHRVGHGFLPALGQPDDTGRQWLQGPHRLDGEDALELVLRQAQPALRAGRGVVLAVPDYLSVPQIELLHALAARAGLPVLGSLSVALANALAAFAEQAWFGTVVVLDADEHALTVTALQDANGNAHLLARAVLPALGLGAWNARLLNALADCCILQSRRDPRDCPAAEQSLFDQLEGIIDACRQGRMESVVFQTEHWFQNVVLQPEQTVAFCAPLVQQVLLELTRLFRLSWPKGPPRVLLLTAAVGRLPGLVPALQACMDSWERSSIPEKSTGLAAEEDFGEGLLGADGPGEPQAVVVLSPDAAARGAHTIAAHFQRGDLPHRHLDVVAPLPLPQPPDAGPARLQYQGQDFLLRERAITLGRQSDCDLVFDRARYPHVSPRHCEILYDPEVYLLRDLSREGTWVNDRPVVETVQLRPGDWIRLGVDGPVLRFLGQPAPVVGPWAVASG
jgi:hypothetical protein